MSVDVVMAGNLLVDDIVFGDGTTRLAQAGGALRHASLAAAAWGMRVGCVSVVGDDYPADALAAMRARGVALDGVRPLGAPGLRVWLLHEDGARHMVSRRGRPSHDEVSPAPDEVPPAWRDARCLHVAPMPFDRQRAMVSAYGGARQFVSVDPCVSIDDSTLDAWRAVLSRSDAVFASDDELRVERLDALAVGRLRYVVHKQGARGGALYDAHTRALWRWDPLPARVVDVTGAGDAFAAGFLSAMVEGADVAAAIACGAATASVAIEGDGAASLESCSRDELDARAARCVVRRVSPGT